MHNLGVHEWFDVHSGWKRSEQSSPQQSSRSDLQEHKITWEITVLKFLENEQMILDYILLFVHPNQSKHHLKTWSLSMQKDGAFCIEADLEIKTELSCN